jgi:hypothetical protein
VGCGALADFSRVRRFCRGVSSGVT